MYAKNAQSTPTHQQEVTNKETAFATLARQAWMVDFVQSVLLERSRLRLVMTNVQSVWKANIPRSLVPLPMNAKHVPNARTHQKQAMKKLTAHATLDQLGPTVAHVQSVLLVNTRLQQATLCAQNAQQDIIPQKSALYQMNANNVAYIQMLPLQVMNKRIARATLVQRVLMVVYAHCVKPANIK